MSALAEVVAAADPALAPHAVSEPPPGRFEHVDGVRGFVLEAVYEGYLMHYGEPRAFTGMDRDMRLLAGDALYALGLARLAETGDLEAHAAFCRGMLDRGVYLPPSQFEAWFPSLAHTDADVERTLDAAREALA